MEKEELRKVQLTQLEMLREVVRICDMHGIDYGSQEEHNLEPFAIMDLFPGMMIWILLC